MRERSSHDTVLWNLGVASVSASWLFPGAAGRSLALPLSLLGLALLVVAGARAARFGRGLALAALVVSVQALVSLPVLAHALEPRSLPLLATVAAVALDALGLQAAAEGGTLFLFHGGEPTEFRFTAEKTSLLFLAQVLSTWWVLARFPGAPRLRFGRALALTAVYSAARVVVLVLVAGHLERPLAPFVDPAVLAASWLPFPFLLGLLGVLGFERAEASEGDATRAGARRRVAFAAAAGIALAAGLCGFDPGRAKAGRVLVDEAHGDWETTAEPFDRENLGHKSLYTYGELGRVIETYFGLETIREGRLTAERLAAADVLVLRTPTELYAPNEVAAVVDFVSAGGGLLLLGDHTNVLSMGAHLNDVAQAFGIHFRADHAVDLGGDTQFVYRTPALPLRHPALVHVDRLRTLSGCTFAASALDVEAPMAHPRLLSESADYSTASFFAEGERSGFDVVGPQRLAAAAPHGRGRVVALGDSTIFSNFTLHDAGRRELLVGTLAHLNRANLLPSWLRPALRALGILGAFAILVLAARDGAAGRSLPALWVAFVGTALLLGALKLAAHPWPEPRRAVERVVVWDGDDPLESERGGYQHLFLALARDGGWPERVVDLGDLDPAELLVVHDPARELRPREVRAVHAFLERGGRALWLEHGGRVDGFGRELLARSGLGLQPALVRGELHDARPASPFGALSTAGPLALLDAGNLWTHGEPIGPVGATRRGGIPQVEVVGGRTLQEVGAVPVSAVADVGDGRLLVTTLGASLSDEHLGRPVFDRVSEELLAAQHEILFQLLDVLRERAPAEAPE